MINTQLVKFLEQRIKEDYRYLERYGNQHTTTSDISEPLHYHGILPILEFYLSKDEKNSLKGKRILDLGFGVTFFPEELWRRGATVRGLDASIDLYRGPASSTFYRYEYDLGYLPNVPDKEVRKLKRYLEKTGLTFRTFQFLLNKPKPGFYSYEKPPEGYFSWIDVPDEVKKRLHGQRFEKDVNGKTTLDEARKMMELFERLKGRAIKLEDIKLPRYRNDTYKARTFKSNGKVREFKLLEGHLESEDGRIWLEQGYIQNLDEHFIGEKFDAIISAALMETGRDQEFGKQGMQDGAHGMFMHIEKVTHFGESVSKNEINQAMMGIKQKLKPGGILITKTLQKSFLTKEQLKNYGFDVEYFGDLPMHSGDISIARL